MKRSMLNIKVLREIKSNFKQYLSVILIASLAITLFTGIWSNYKNFEERLQYLYDESNMCDAIVTTKTYDADLEEYLTSLDTNFEKRIFIPAKSATQNIYAVIFQETDTMNRPASTTVEQITGQTVLVEENFLAKTGLKIGDRFPISATLHNFKFDLEFVIVGTMVHPESLENTSHNPSFIYIGHQAMIEAIVASLNQPFITESLVASMMSSFSNQFLIKDENSTEIVSKVKTEFADSDNLIYALNRSELPSNMTIEADVTQAKQLLYIFPVIFYLVALLIILTSISQLIHKEQKNIGILKALGFSKFEILSHYTKIFLVLGILGAALGILLGPLIVPNVMGMKYNILYQLPPMKLPFFRVEYLLSLAILIVITILTSIFACYAAMNQEPAASLRGDNAVKMRVSRLAKFKIFDSISLSVRMAFRNMKRKKSRTLMVILGVLGCSSLLVCGFGIEDTINYGLDLELKELIPFDISATYSDNTSHFTEITEMEQVEAVDEYAKYSVNIEKNHLIASYVYLLPEESNIFVPEYSDSSCIVSKKVSEEIGCSVGDEISFVHESKTYRVEVTSIVDFCISQGVLLSRNHFEDLAFIPSGAWVKTSDTSLNDTLSEQIGNIAGVSSSITMAEMTARAEDTIGSIKVMTWTIKIFAILLAVVVLYNLALLNFKERTKDIATLKVLGFSKYEITLSFMIEILTLTFVGALIGLAFGHPLLVAVLSINENPLISYIYHIFPMSYIWTVVITCGSSLVINLFFSFLIKRVQMVESLKSVE